MQRHFFLLLNGCDILAPPGHEKVSTDEIPTLLTRSRTSLHVFFQSRVPSPRPKHDMGSFGWHQTHADPTSCFQAKIPSFPPLINDERSRSRWDPAVPVSASVEQHGRKRWCMSAYSVQNMYMRSCTLLLKKSDMHWSRKLSWRDSIQEALLAQQQPQKTKKHQVFLDQCMSDFFCNTIVCYHAPAYWTGRPDFHHRAFS